MPANKQSSPPRLAQRLLKLFLFQEEVAEKLGDLTEAYHQYVSERSKMKARYWYWLQVIKAIPVCIKNILYWNTIMLKNYLKISLRNIRKSKIYSFINVAGLGLGIAGCILISAYVFYEFSYDSFHEKADRIYRVALKADLQNRQVETPTTSPPVGPTLQEEYPAVISSARIFTADKQLLAFGDIRFYEDNVLFADNTVFEIFSFRMLNGNPADALSRAYSIVLTDRIANKYFGEADPVGKILKVNGTDNFTVTGVMESLPANSHLSFDVLFSFETLDKRSPEKMHSWLGFNYHTYLLLAEGADAAGLEAKLADFDKRHFGEVMQKIGGSISHYLQPLRSIHLYSNLEYEIGVNSSIRYIYAFSAIALIILLLACINFMNLSTARSAGRAREVGVRKTFGAHKAMLARQFMSESFLMTFLAFAVAAAVVNIFLPDFNSLAGTDIQFSYLLQPVFLLSVFGIFIITALIAGSYPAWLLSAFNPVTVLKGSFSTGMKRSALRSGMVVFQFAISIALISGTGIVLKQVHYLKNKNLGFNKKQMLVVALQDSQMKRDYEHVKEWIKALDGVIAVTVSSYVPGEGQNVNAYFPEGGKKNEFVIMENIEFDPDFLDCYNIGIIEGRGFSPEFTNDTSSAVLINRKAARHLGWEDNPIGKAFYIPRFGSGAIKEMKEVRVVGVTEDFHLRPLYHKIEPMIFQYQPETFRRVTVKIAPGKIPSVLGSLKSYWAKSDLEHPFEYYFLDSAFDSRYRSEERLGAIFRTFAALAVIIGCLGLFGLASYTAEQRTREIGIRKSLGATGGGIVLLLSREFVKWVLLANIIAWPAAYFIMNRWLRDFPYRTETGVRIFLLSGVIALGIALATVLWQAVRAARANPVDSLKYE